MISLDASIGVALLSGILAVCGASVLAALLYPPIRSRMIRLEPRLQHRLLFLILIAPLLTGSVFAALLIGPATDYGVVTRHCHDAGFAGCTPHVQKTFGASLSLLTALIILALAAWPLVRLSRRAGELREAKRLLALASAPNRRRGVAVVEDRRPFAFSLGFLRPVVFVSTGLRDRLSACDLDIVLRHELAHSGRRDSLSRLLAALFSIGHRRDIARLLLADLHLAAERACDEEAAKAKGRLDVAAAILRVEKLCRAHASALPFGAMAAIGGSVPLRVEALLDPAPAEDRAAQGAIMLMAFLVPLGAFIAAEPVHHVVEAFLYRFLG